MSRASMVLSGEGIFGTGWLSNPLGEIMDVDTEIQSHDRQLLVGIRGVGQNDSRAIFYRAVWIPFFAGWEAFRDNQASTLASMGRVVSPYYTRDVYKDAQEYRGKLVAMNTAATEAGFSFVGPSPTPPRTNVVEDAYHEGKHAVVDLWETLKVILYIALGAVVVGGLIYLVRFYRG